MNVAGLLPVTPLTPSEKVAVTPAVTATPVALAAGDWAVTVGGVVSAGAAVVKVQDTVASGVPVAPLMADAPPVSVAVYCVFATRGANGVNVATWLVGL